jgi:hypothetical protein
MDVDYLYDRIKELKEQNARLREVVKMFIKRAEARCEYSCSGRNETCANCINDKAIRAGKDVMNEK